MRLVRLLACAALTAGCSSRVEQISVTVLTKGCTFADTMTASPNPIADVDHYQVSITGQGIPDAITTSFAVKGTATIPNVTPGPARVMTITGYQGDPTGSTAVVRASGTSTPFDVPTVVGAPVKVTVVLRPMGLFSGANEGATPGTCATLAVPRAGHTATLLQDGRVLVAGGFSVAPSATGAGASVENNWVFHPETEIFDPRNGSVVAASPMQDPNAGYAITYQRAFHTATLISSGQVVVLGGEVVAPYPDGGLVANAAVQNQQTIAAYTPSADSWQFLRLGVNAIPYATRSRHVALFDPQTNDILMVGGVVFGGGAVPTDVANTPAWVDPQSGIFSPVYIMGNGTQPMLNPDLSPTWASFGAVGAAGAPWQNAFIVANGLELDGGQPQNEPTVGYIQWSPTIGTDGGYWLYYEQDEFSVSMTPSRGNTAMVSLSATSTDDSVLIAGGFADAGRQPVTNTQNIYSHTVGGSIVPGVNAGPALTHPRGDLCAAALADGRAFTAGGDDGETTSADSELWGFNAAGQLAISSSTPMFYPRKWHTCTLLQDGSVAVIGGVTTTAVGGFKVLGSIEIYTPTPLAAH